MIGRSHLSGWKVLGLLACLSLAGCGASKGTVEGTVTYKGKPLPVGTVTFFVGNKVATASVSDGSYKALNVPAGSAKVAVLAPESSGGGAATSEMSKGMAKMMAQAPPDAKLSGGTSGSSSTKAVPIPKQYGSPDTSGITTTVRGGKNNFDIDLK